MNMHSTTSCDFIKTGLLLLLHGIIGIYGQACDGTEEAAVSIVDSGTVARVNYGFNDRCTWKLTCSDASMVPRLTFSDGFDLGSNDRMDLYDGDQRTDVLQTVQGTTAPAAALGIGATLTAQFVSTCVDDRPDEGTSAAPLDPCPYSEHCDKTCVQIQASYCDSEYAFYQEPARERCPFSCGTCGASALLSHISSLSRAACLLCAWVSAYSFPL